MRLFQIAAAATATLTACDKPVTGPVTVSAIGEAPKLANPNLVPLDAPSAFLVSAVAQGLVRFDAGAQIEPALAQSWIVSDDGLRYTFRLARTRWTSGGPVTAEQVVARLRAASSAASRNPLKAQLGVIDEIETMTGDVLEISLKAPRPNFLQLLAQPEMAIMRGGAGTGPYLMAARGRVVALTVPVDEDRAEGGDGEDLPAEVLLHGERAALAVARFDAGQAELVIGGTAGNLPVARAAELPAAALRLDPVGGLFGFAFERAEGTLDEPAVRQALAMALDRESIVAALAVPGLASRLTLAPALEELPDPATPAWAALAPPARRAEAASVIAGAGDGEPLRIRVAVPDGPGYRIVFALARRDWAGIGVIAEAVGERAQADLRLIDHVAPTTLASWYLRRFGCASSRVCSAEADAIIDQARIAQSLQERRVLLAAADARLEAVTPFIPIAAPIRWSLVAPRLTGFQANAFARHFPETWLQRRR